MYTVNIGKNKKIIVGKKKFMGNVRLSHTFMLLSFKKSEKMMRVKRETGIAIYRGTFLICCHLVEILKK